MEILQNAKIGIKKTHIMFKVGLSFSQLEQYLSALKNAGFITAKKTFPLFFSIFVDLLHQIIKSDANKKDYLFNKQSKNQLNICRVS